MLLIVISIYMNDIEAFENNIATRATASRQVNLYDTVYTPNIKLHQIVGANDTLYEPSICFNLKNSNNQSVLSQTEKEVLTSVGITDVNSMDRVCLTKKHFISLYSIRSIMDQFRRNISNLFDKAKNIRSWKDGADTGTNNNKLKLQEYLLSKYYPKSEVYSKTESRNRFLPKAKSANDPYLTQTMGDILFEPRTTGINYSNYYLSRPEGDRLYARYNPDYITVDELRRTYEPKGEYMSENLLAKHMEDVSNRIINAAQTSIVSSRTPSN